MLTDLWVGIWSFAQRLLSMLRGVAEALSFGAWFPPAVIGAILVLTVFLFRWALILRERGAYRHDIQLFALALLCGLAALVLGIGALLIAVLLTGFNPGGTLAEIVPADATAPLPSLNQAGPR